MTPAGDFGALAWAFCLALGGTAEFRVIGFDGGAQNVADFGTAEFLQGIWLQIH